MEQTTRNTFIFLNFIFFLFACYIQANFLSTPNYLFRDITRKEIRPPYQQFNRTVFFESENKTRCYRQVQVWRGSSTPQKLIKAECPELTCGINLVKDTSYETMVNSDAIIFYHLSSWNWVELQRRRPMNQAWIFYSRESPPLTGRYAVPPNKLDRIYNFTMTYRLSSTIPISYGVYHSGIGQISSDDNRNWAEGKTGLIAWVSSKCRGRGRQSWRRLEFVETLAKHISVDTYGYCGNKVCKRRSDFCRSVLRNHKFYLALENHECRDYITEKFWKNALLHESVPIVYGAPRKDYERVAPPNSFIHLQDFKNFSDLVYYINLLNSNDTLYNMYFEWKKKGSIQCTGNETVVLKSPFLCKVVSILLDQHLLTSNSKEGRKKHPSIHEYWTTSCMTPTGFPRDF
ncbi:alpha-(1,3)-fucosyltransferase 7-like [Lytechinus pictus]|uniref:alpha-(1,3)-fucosyltransferase 7-like n=1 Tax=Lytechinus pictus TaxID=7653 RepID=UPI0030B9E88F